MSPSHRWKPGDKLWERNWAIPQKLEIMQLWLILVKSSNWRNAQKCLALTAIVVMSEWPLEYKNMLDMYTVWARFGCHLMTPPRSMFQWQIAPSHWQIMGVKPIQIHRTLLDISTIGCIPELRGSCLCLQQQMRGEANRVANLPTCPCQYSAAYLGDFSSLIDERTNFEWSGMKRVKTTMMTTMTMTLLTHPPASRVGESISQMTQPHTALW